MTIARLFAIGLAMAVLAGCSGLAPYATAPLAPEPGRRDPGPRVAICYNGLVSSRTQIGKAAQQECGPRTRAVPVGTDWHLDNCPILLPARANFACAPADRH